MRMTNRAAVPHSLGRRPKIDWNRDNLDKLKLLINDGASHDDLQAAFNGLGLTTILCGARILVQEMSAAEARS